mgnify:CR=1 FL=1
MASRRIRFGFAGIVAALLVAACGAAFVAPEVDGDLVAIGQARWPDTTQTSLQAGRDVFTASCGKGGLCHRLPTPRSRTEAQWGPIMDRMARKAQLDPDRRESVLRFILAVRDLPAQNPNP